MLVVFQKMQILVCNPRAETPRNQQVSLLSDLAHYLGCCQWPRGLEISGDRKRTVQLQSISTISPCLFSRSFVVIFYRKFFLVPSAGFLFVFSYQSNLFFQILQKLLSAGAKIDIKDDEEKIPLHMATE